MDRLLSMRVFQSVIAEGGFAAASRAMNLSPANVTRLVSDLEQSLGTRLLQRTTRKMALTDAGQSYLDRIHGILGEIDEAEAAARQSSGELRGVVSVVAFSLFANHFLGNKIALWQARHPAVSLSVSVDPHPQHRVEDFDVTFMVLPDGADSNVVARPIGKTDYVVCASPAYLTKRGRPTEPAQLQGHDYLRFPLPGVAAGAARPLRLCHVDGQQEVDIEMRVVLQADNYETLFRAAAQGAGVAMLPKFFAQEYLDNASLIQLLPDWIFGHYTAYVALPTRKLTPARTRAFVDFAIEMMPKVC